MDPKAKTCPTCESTEIRTIRSDYPATVRGRQVVIPDLERQECPVCGEVLFDRAAMKKIQSYWPETKLAPTK
jgi:YgiT-type zinc finger domain-containing protein